MEWIIYLFCIEYIIIKAELPPNLAFLDLRDNPIFPAADSDSSKHTFDVFVDNLPNLIQLNGVDLSDERLVVDDETTTTTIESEKNDDRKKKLGEDRDVSSLRDVIVERSRVRHRNDRISLEHEWEQKKAKLESIRASMNEKFKFNNNHNSSNISSSKSSKK